MDSTRLDLKAQKWTISAPLYCTALIFMSDQRCSKWNVMCSHHYSHSYSYTLSFSACHSISYDTTGHDPCCNLSWSLSQPLSAQTEHRKMVLADLPSKEALWEGGEFALAVLNEVALFTHEVIKLLAFLRYHHPGVLLHAQSQCWKSK